MGIKIGFLRASQKISNTNLVKVGVFLATFPQFERKAKLYRQGVKPEKKLFGFRG